LQNKQSNIFISKLSANNQLLKNESLNSVTKELKSNMQNEIDNLKREYKLIDDNQPNDEFKTRKSDNSKLNQELTKELERFNQYFEKNKKSNQFNIKGGAEQENMGLKKFN